MSNIAVISLAGAQYLVKPGDRLEINRLASEVDAKISPEVLLSTDGDDVLFNEGKIEAKVLEHKKGEKLYVVKFKAKSRYRNRTGHRQALSVIEVISINGQKKEEEKKAPKPKPVKVEAKSEATSKPKASAKTSTKKTSSKSTKKGPKK